jgi:hypothetical protein
MKEDGNYASMSRCFAVPQISDALCREVVWQALTLYRQIYLHLADEIDAEFLVW